MALIKKFEKIFVNFFLSFFFMCVALNLCSQEINIKWERDLVLSLYQFFQCKEEIDDISPCNRFVGESLKVVYKIDDFYSIEKKRYLLANEIADFLSQNDNWTLLGHCDNQEALINAQGYANLKKAVVAIMKAKSQGHIALIIPGKLEISESWGNMRVPNSASFFINKPTESYVGKKLSFAFQATDQKKVMLYGRNY